MEGSNLVKRPRDKMVRATMKTKTPNQQSSKDDYDSSDSNEDKMPRSGYSNSDAPGRAGAGDQYNEFEDFNVAIYMTQPIEGEDIHCDWEEYEDLKLREAFNIFGKTQWKKVANYVVSKTSNQCIQRWLKVIKPSLVKGAWSQEEDDKLRQLVMQDFQNWGKLAIHMQGRTAKQCRERWNYYLDPNVNRSDFTDEEDRKLLQLHATWGNKWAYISRELPGRTDSSVKSRYRLLLRGLKANMRPNTTASVNTAQTSHLHEIAAKSVALALVQIRKNEPLGSKLVRFFENSGSSFLHTPLVELLQLNEN